MRLENPYRGRRGRWVRASFHTHTAENSPCASVPLAEGVRWLRELGAEVVAITDHDRVTDLQAMERTYPDTVFLQGVEHSHSAHYLFVGRQVPPLYELPLPEAAARADGELLQIVAHPCADEANGWTVAAMDQFARETGGRLPHGIEIIDGHYTQARIVARGVRYNYTALWDELLSAGYRLWGYANDDFHDPIDLDNAHNLLLVETLSAEAVLEAARVGCCYASTGLTLRAIHEREGHIVIDVGRLCTGRFVGPGGRVLAEARGARFAYTATEERYVRFEAKAGRAELFTQPMFREDAPYP